MLLSTWNRTMSSSRSSCTAICCLLMLLLLLCDISIKSNAFRSTRVFQRFNIMNKLTLSMDSKGSRWDPPKQVLPVTDSDAPKGVYTVELPKSCGISWGSDISFRWIYVLALDDQGAAASAGIIEKGDYIIGVGNSSLIAADFDTVITTLAKQPTMTNFTFFRGEKSELVGEQVLDPSEMTCKVTVKEKGKPDKQLSCPGGTNLRQLLVGNGVNVYRSITRWTNCSGKQRCGTCIVSVQQGKENCSRKGLEEDMVLRENPDNYRLSCITSVYGDLTVEVQGAVTAAQWTR